MTQAKNETSGDKAPAAVDRTRERTPGADVQPEDTGTPASGNAGDSESPGGSAGTPAQAAMKQFQKTDAETGSRGPSK
jgi:hypothetical protein